MRIGLASDTHGNLAPLARALEAFERGRVDRVFFLGGRVADVDAVLARRPPAARPPAGWILRVASRACPEYHGGQVPRMQVDLLEGRIGCLVHDKAELGRDDIENATLLFHGNAAGAALVRFGSRCFVTPGHLRPPGERTTPATFAIAEVTARELVLTVYGEEGTEERRERAPLATSGKLSVR